ncbi:MAG: hypothetical protein WCV69_03240 [Patescibacteria group bacterium]|jgi:hypothetical protein
MSTQEISPDQQEKVVKMLYNSDDGVSAIHNLRAKIGNDHIGKVTMSLHDFARTIKPHFEHHQIQQHIHDVTKQNIHLDSL